MFHFHWSRLCLFLTPLCLTQLAPLPSLSAQVTPERVSTASSSNWFRGRIVRIDLLKQIADVELVDGSQRGLLRTLRIADGATIARDGTRGDLRNLTAGQLVDFRAVRRGDVLVADCVSVCDPESGGGSGGNGSGRRQFVPLANLAGGGGGNGDGRGLFGTGDGGSADSSNPATTTPLTSGGALAPANALTPGETLSPRGSIIPAGRGLIGESPLGSPDHPAHSIPFLSFTLTETARCLEDLVHDEKGLVQDAVTTARLVLAHKLRLAADAVDALKDKTGDKLADAKQVVVSRLQDAADACGNLDQLLDKVSSVKSHLASALRDVADCIAGGALGEVKGTVGDVKSNLVSAIDRLAGCSCDLLNPTKDVPRLVTHTLRHVAWLLAHTAGEVRGELVEVKQLLVQKLLVAAELTEGLKDQVDATLGDARQKIVTTLREAADICGNLDGLLEKAQGVKSKLVQALHDTADCFVDGTLDNVKEAAGDAANRIVGVTHRLKGAAEFLVGEVKDKTGDVHALLAHKLRLVARVVERLIGRTNDELHDAKQLAVRKLIFAADAVEALKEKTGDKVADAKQLAINALQEAAEACGKLDGLLGKVETVKQTLADALTEAAGCLVGNTVETVKDTVGAVDSKLISAVQHVQEGAGQLVEKIVHVPGITPVQAIVDGYLDGDVDALGLVDAYVWVDTRTLADVALRGNIHEAFARPLAWTNSIVVVRGTLAPPENLNDELAVEVVGNALVWVNGYWSYNSIDQKFEWTGGILRRPPPGHHWIPGKWIKVNDGFARIPGAWIPNKLSAPVKVAKLPASLNFVQNGTRPSLQHFWVPGKLSNSNGQLIQGAGHWAPINNQNSKWVWTPAQVIPTGDGGGLVIDGFWDHPTTERGVLFAPVRLGHGASPDVMRKLATAVSLNVPRLFQHLFVDGRTQQYVFGNVYGDAAEKAGLIPWVDFATQSRSFDPLFAHYSRLYALSGADFKSRLLGWHRFFAGNPLSQPPVTLVELVNFMLGGVRDHVQLAAILPANIDPAALRELQVIGLDSRRLAILQSNLGSVSLAELGQKRGASVEGLALGNNHVIGALNGTLLGTSPYTGLGTGDNLGYLRGIGTLGGTIGGGSITAFGSNGGLIGSVGGLGSNVTSRVGGTVGTLGGTVGGVGGNLGGVGGTLGGTGGIGNTIGGVGNTLGGTGTLGSAGLGGTSLGSGTSGIGGGVGGAVGGLGGTLNNVTGTGGLGGIAPK